MRVAAVTGLSGSGKTTLIEALIRLFAARGERVAAIKHTHHPLNVENRGDTARFLAAGASPVVLVSGGEAAIWSAAATPPLCVKINESGGMAAALQIVAADIVLVEGFKDERGVPRIEPRTEPHEAVGLLDRIWRLRYRAVLFDLDGTLVDSYAALAEAVNFARRRAGHEELPEGRVRDFVGDGLEKLLERAFGGLGVPDGAREDFEARYDAICCEESKVLEDVEATLGELSTLGVIMAVCTNKPTAFSRKILTFLGLAPFFRAIVGPDLAGARKPDAQHVLHTLQATDCAAADALFVGDMPIDVHAARNSGVAVAVVPTGASTPDQLKAAAPDHYLDRFADLVNLVTL